MGIIMVGLFGVFLVLLIVFGLSKKSENKLISFFVCIFAVVLLSICLYVHIAVPTSISDYGVYCPFNDREIFQKTWESERNGEYLFSVVEITVDKKDTLDEIFLSDIENLQTIKTNKDYLIVFDNNFYSITKEQKDKILKLDLDEVQTKKFLGWERF